MSGANLRDRMEAIVTRTVGFELSVPRRVALAAALVMGITGPVIVGALEASSPLSPVEMPQDVPLILPEPASFEVASVKPSPADVQAPGIRPIQGNRFLAVGMTTRTLMQVAYGRQGTLLSTQIISDVTWLDSERFDITAISEALTAPGDRFTTLRGLLQRLLRDRFQAQVHVETRTLPIYELVMARQDGRPGPQLRPPAAPCVDFFGVSSNGVPTCGFTRVRPGDWAARSIDLGLFATNLAFLPEVGRVVRDRTGLQERFDLELRFNPQAVPAGDLSPDPSLFTALQEQLGLKLQPSRGPVEVLAVDRIERPTAD